jgi:hypothetical protein
MKKLIRKTLFSFLLLVCANSLSAQVWNTVGVGLVDFTFGSMPVSATDGDTLYVAYCLANTNPVQAKLSKWDGNSWSTINIPNPTNETTVKDIVLYNGDVYVNINNFYGKYDGSGWTYPFPPGYLGWQSSATVFNGELYIAGDFYANGGISRLMKYDGTTFSAVSNISNGAGINQVSSFNGELIIYDVTSFLSKNSSGNWIDIFHYSDMKNFYSFYLQQFIEYDGKLYGQGWENLNGNCLVLFENDTASFIGSLGNYFSTSDFAVFNNQLYITSSDSSTSKSPSLYKYDGTTFSSVAGTPNVLVTADSVNGEFFTISKADSSFNGISHNYAYRSSALYSLLKGNVYYDSNGDCFKNPGEQGIEKVFVSLDNKPEGISNTLGHYSISVIPGSYTFGQAIYSPTPTRKNLTSTCNLPNPIVIGANQTLTQDIGLQNNTPNDLVLTVEGYTGWRARHGFSEAYKISLSNAGNITVANAEFELTIPSTVTIDSIVPSPSNQNGTTYTFNMLNLNPFETREVKFYATINTTSNSVGDSLSWHVNTVGFVGDADISDNAMTLKQIIVGAFDPNDKQASASHIVPSANKIDYHIRFQNTGTDTAYKVVVIDTLDVNLPSANIVINSSSHPYSLSIIGNILIWTFDNILLPDSGANYLGSQGYVNFSTGINSGLVVGDTIKNKAEIYFDFQKPVITNHAKTAVVQTISINENEASTLGLKVYPNPAKDFITIENSSGKSMVVTVTDMQGRIVKKFNLERNDNQQIDINELKAGTYVLSSEDSKYKLIVTE